MKSLVTKIIGACLGLSLATGIGVSFAAGQKEMKQADAADSLVYTLDGTITGGSNGYATASTLTQSNISWSIYGNTTQSPWRIGGKSLSGVDREVFTNEKLSSYNISKVELAVGSADSITVNSVKLKVGTAKQGSQTSTVNGTFSANSTITFNRPNGADWSNKFFDFVFNVTVSGTDNRFLQFKNAKFYQSSDATLTSVEITGSLTKTSYVYGEGWTHNGLKLMGHYSDNTTKEVTSGVAWSYNPGCTNYGVTSLTVSAEVGGLTASYTTDVTITKIASPFVNGVPYKMYLHNTNDNTDYYFIGAMGTGSQQYYGATTSDSSSTSIVNMYFEPREDGQALYFYANNNTSGTKQYIYIAVNDTHVNFKFGTTAATFYYNGTSVCTYVAGVDGIYGMGSYGSNKSFGASASFMSSNYFAQFELVNALTAEDFANQFLDVVVCDSTGASAPTYNYNYTWQALSDLFDQLGTSAQNTLKTVDITGTDVVAQAMARYNLIVGKYGYTNFINRTISNVSNRMINVNNNSGVIITVIVIIALAMSSAVAFYVLKKKKFER